ncbi:hypothetical protein NBH00_18450 [Paraconexibacter antarcticus]|uniref:Transmembrane protein n=1 Tax=Paraconexibacter antarcticus TaxID=2949664 RepID=A0ABY5DRW9_9ACTN|nr:hypothetical protein [Paraconexibacter antarcticus]UTI63324.1 hypothetical protein NBH00_18450 [Paraconexibacter antarcticus]
MLDIGMVPRHPDKWTKRSLAMEQDRIAIDRAVLRSKRAPDKSLRELPKYSSPGCQPSPRLSRCVAFGRWATQVPEGQENNAQFGIFGTSAALQILSQSHWADSLKAGESGGTLAEWVPVYLRTVNFLDFVVQASLSPNPPPVATEVEISLRACQAAKAFASAAPVLDKLREPVGHIAKLMEPAVLKDLSFNLHDVSKRNVRILMEGLAKAQRSSADAPKEAFRPTKVTPSTPLYAFTQRAVDFPSDVNDWVFLQSSVLTTVVRCWTSQVLTDHELAKRVLPGESVAALRHVLEDPPEELDPRARLLGLWALSHLDRMTAGGPLSQTGIGVTFLATGEFHSADVRWCAGQVRGVCAALLEREASLADTSSPYYFVTGPAEADYKSDHLVTPVVPLVLSLSARYAPTFLSRRSVLDLLESCVLPVERISVFAARPHQLSTEDGVVNLSYYHEASAEISRAGEAISGEFWTRISGHFGGFLADWGRLTVLAMFVLIGGIAFTVASLVHSSANGFLFGIFASMLAAVVGHGLVGWLWGDR